jgi:hypothetical protein
LVCHTGRSRGWGEERWERLKDGGTLCDANKAVIILYIYPCVSIIYRTLFNIWWQRWDIFVIRSGYTGLHAKYMDLFITEWLSAHGVWIR